MPPLNPITDAAVLAIDPALEPEHRLQSLLRLWLGKYFNGQPFTTRAVGGGTQQQTFMDCLFMWQEDVEPENPQKPILHLTFSPAASERLDLAARSTGHGDRWLIDIMVKVPRNVTGTPMAGKKPDQVCRKLAGQVQWLFASSERASLSERGVMEMKQTSAPAPLPGLPWSVRVMSTTCLTRRSQAK